MGNWVFGCDLCQIVCPWQRFAIQTQGTSFFPVDADRAAPPLAELLDLTPDAFQQRFAGSAVLRAGRDQMVRNACLAAANGAQAALAPRLGARLRADASAVVRGHAGWALGRLWGAAAGPALTQALSRETDPDCRADLETTLSDLG
jgi:epoxyqueuosine reductase